jgi:hypothetical protein
MEALNAKERTVALLKFLAIFLILLILGVWGIFYDVRIPFKQIELLKEQNASLNGNVQYQKQVLLNMDSLFYQFSRYDKAMDKEILNPKIGGEISKLSDIANSDSITVTGKIVGRANNIFGLYFIDKKLLATLSGTSSELTDKDQKLKELSDKNDKLQEKLDNCQRDNQNLRDKIQR